MTISEFIEELRQKEIELSFSGGKLNYSGPEEHITPELVNRLKSFKGKLIKHFWPHELSIMMPINTEGERTPLFIVHGDYANYAISECLCADQPVYGFFHPGSEGEPIRYKSVKDMAAMYLEKVLSVCPSGPFNLMGFSFGGILAFEMAVQLQKAGRSVPLLVLLDSVSPFAKEAIPEQPNLYMSIRKKIMRPVWVGFKRLIKLYICELYSFLNLQIPANRRADYIFVKYLSLVKKYSPDKFRGKMILFRTDENPSSSKNLGWDNLVDQIKLIELKGKHLEIFEDRKNKEIVQKEIKNSLELIPG